MFLVVEFPATTFIVSVLWFLIPTFFDVKYPCGCIQSSK